MSPRPPRPFRIEVRVRYGDTDAAGVVYYANYLRYFEAARVDALRELGLPIREAEARGILLPAVSARCDYRRPAFVDDLLWVDMWLDHRGRGSLGFSYEVLRDDELIATGSTRHAVVDRETLRPRRLDGWLAELLQRAEERQTAHS